MNGKSMLYGLLTGSMLAGICTLLITPQAGIKTRKQITEKIKASKELLEKGKMEASALKEQLQETTTISKDTIKLVSTEVKHSVEDWQKEVEPTITQLKNEIDLLQKTLSKQNK